jgi:hypothetical protein
MAVIDSTYFYNLIHIPSLGNTVNAASFADYLTQYEKESIERLLGYELAKEVLAYTTGTGRISDIVNGKEFTVNSRLYKWIGLKNTEKKSIIANYVYYKYMEDNASQNFVVGNSIPQAENSERVNPVSKMVLAYNNMLKMVDVLYLFLEENAIIYPEFKRSDIDEDFLNYRNSLDL